MRRALLISAALLLVASEPVWSRQEQQQSQSQPAQQQSSQQSQKQVQAPQQDPLAVAARKAREQKKEAPKNTKVFTNDNIPTAGGISSVGEEEEPKNEDKVVKAGASESGNAKSGSAPSAEAQWRSRFAKLRHKLEQDQADLDVMQRELGVLSTQYYSDPNKELQQQLTREDINKKTADIEARKKDVEADKQAISDAEDELRKAGGDPGWANPQ